MLCSDLIHFLGFLREGAREDEGMGRGREKPASCLDVSGAARIFATSLQDDKKITHPVLGFVLAFASPGPFRCGFSSPALA